MFKTKPSGNLELLPSSHPGSMGLWDPGGQRSLGGRVRFPCGLSSLSPKGPGGATPRLHSLLRLALAMPNASPRPGTAVLPLASRHHSWAGRGGRPARSLQLRREPFLAGGTPPPRLSCCTVPWLAPPNPRVHRVCPHRALFSPASWAAPSTCFFRSCKPLLAMAAGGLRVVKGSRSDVGSCSKRLRPESQLWFLRRPRAGPSPHEGGLEGARGGSQHSGSGE